MNLHDLLGTKNRKQQEQLVSKLVRDAQAPVIDLIIRWDLRDDSLDVRMLGADKVPIQQVYALLDRVRQDLMLQEARARQETPPASPAQPQASQAEGDAK